MNPLDSREKNGNLNENFGKQDEKKASTFVPGQNVHAQEFVPSFNMGVFKPPLVVVPQPSASDIAQEFPNFSTISSTQSSENIPDVSLSNLNVEENTKSEDISNNNNDKLEDEEGSTWSDKASEEGSVAGDESDSKGGEDSDVGGKVEKPIKVKKAPKVITQKTRKNHLNIIFIGHVDAGKSTIGGHIMYLTGQVDKRTLEKYEKEAKEKNRESWYLSWALDTNPEERDKGKTVEVGRAFFETENKHFTILDAPGHKSFVPNMIGAASQADLAVLVISARKGEFETGFERGGQTQEHAMLVKTSGVRHLVIVVNKMDDPTVKWEERRFIEIKEKLTPYLKKCGFNPKTDIFYIPVSGLTGVNLKENNSKLCPWYNGPTLIKHLDDLPPVSRMSEGPVRLPIVDRFKDMGTIGIGKVESGVIVKGQILTLMPNRMNVEVMQLWSDEEETDQANPGENVKIKLKNVEEEDVSPGFILCSPDNLCHTAKVFDAQVVILEHKSIICAGYSAVLHIHACAEEATINALLCLIDKKTNEKSKKAPKFIKQDQVAIVRLEMGGGMICLETFKNFPQMGRFSLRDEGRTIAIGKVLKVIN